MRAVLARIVERFSCKNPSCTDVQKGMQRPIGTFKRAAFFSGKAASPLLLSLIAGACSLQPHYERPIAPIPFVYPDPPVNQSGEGSADALTKKKLQEKVEASQKSASINDTKNAIHASSGSSIQLGSAGTVGFGKEIGTLSDKEVAVRASIDASEDITSLDAGWQVFLGDPRLQALVNLALKNNRDVRVAALNVEYLQAQYRIQRAALLPSMGAEGQMVRSRTPAGMSPLHQATVGNQFFVGPVASWQIDFFGKITSLKDAALAQYLSTRFASRAAHIALIAQVADQYLLLRASEAQLGVTKQALTTANKLYELTKLQTEVGTGSALDMQAAVGAQEQAKANYQNQLRLQAQAENALTLLIGQSLPADLPAPLPFANQKIIADIQAGLPSELLTRRPDILAAEATLRAANANIGAARAAFFPSISLTGQFGSASTSLDELFKGGTASWSFTPQVNLPIFQAGANRANLRAAKVKKEIAIAQYEKAIQTAFREVADGLAARGTYDEQLVAQERYVQAVQRRLELSVLRYRNGIESYLSVLTAQTELYAAQQGLITTRLARLVNLIDLYQYLGGPAVAVPKSEA